MKKFLIAYDSRTGNTKQMAEYIAEGISSLGSLRLKEAVVGTQEGMKACHDYGRYLGEQLQ